LSEVKKDINGTLDHVAVVVKDLDAAITIYEDLGLTFSTQREVVKEQGVTTAFAEIDQHAHLELLTPFGEDGPIHKFLEKRGEGIHHLCFSVTDVQAKTIELSDKGYTLIHNEPVIGANNCLVNFIHPKSTKGVLIEISQKQEHSK
jgi:methylmalonyl-CoA/ethylmalonyl-CoA epimerase